jgi:hypothetical protein
MGYFEFIAWYYSVFETPRSITYWQSLFGKRKSVCRTVQATSEKLPVRLKI